MIKKIPKSRKLKVSHTISEVNLEFIKSKHNNTSYYLDNLITAKRQEEEELK